MHSSCGASAVQSATAENSYNCVAFIFICNTRNAKGWLAYHAKTVGIVTSPVIPITDILTVKSGNNTRSPLTYALTTFHCIIHKSAPPVDKTYESSESQFTLVTCSEWP
mmetsp:Transcript_153928/g.269296  ORF Transcript_153928/g.269296 Transcript_153928/m.269296 type:complete len:109 (-) Transcript_153928:2166-2492(-)